MPQELDEVDEGAGIIGMAIQEYEGQPLRFHRSTQTSRLAKDDRRHVDSVPQERPGPLHHQSPGTMEPRVVVAQPIVGEQNPGPACLTHSEATFVPRRRLHYASLSIGWARPVLRTKTS